MHRSRFGFRVNGTKPPCPKDSTYLRWLTCSWVIMIAAESAGSLHVIVTSLVLLCREYSSWRSAALLCQRPGFAAALLCHEPPGVSCITLLNPWWRNVLSRLSRRVLIFLSMFVLSLVEHELPSTAKMTTNRRIKPANKYHPYIFPTFPSVCLSVCLSQPLLR